MSDGPSVNYINFNFNYVQYKLENSTITSLCTARKCVHAIMNFTMYKSYNIIIQKYFYIHYSIISSLSKMLFSFNMK